MAEYNLPPWLKWAREIQSLSQTGLAYSNSDYDIQRYRRLMEIAAEMVQSHTGLPREGLAQNFMAQPGYATVKVGVRGATIRHRRVLSVRPPSGSQPPGSF